MIKNTLSRNALVGVLCGAAVLALKPSAPAADILFSNEYAWVEGGLSMIPDFDAKLTSVTGGGLFEQDLELKMSPGFAVQGGLGERFLPWLSGELLGGFIYNEVDSVETGGGLDLPFNATLTQFPILLNAVIHGPESNRLVPFAGAGAGARISNMEVDDALYFGGTSPVQVEDSSIEVNFAYQFFAGVRLNLKEDSAISLSYRFHGGDSPTWNLEDGSGQSVANLESDGLFIHTISLGFYLSF